MSWSVTVEGVQDIQDLPHTILAKIGEDNARYEADAVWAFHLAKNAGLVSATLAGARTPSMYGGPDTVIISVHGFDSHRVAHAVEKKSHDDMVRDEIFSGPEAVDEE